MSHDTSEQVGTQPQPGSWARLRVRWQADRTIHGMPPSVLLALLLCFVLVVLAILAPLVSPYSPVRASLPERMIPPAWSSGGDMRHPLGTDGFGRDVLSRVIYGARISLSVAGLTILAGGIMGAVVGIVSGYLAGTIDIMLMRIVDILLSVPTVLIAIAIAVVFGPSFRNLVIILSALLWPKIARAVRGEALAVKEQDYVKYAQAIGVPGWRLMIRHILPNVTPVLLVVSTLEVGQVILLEATLGFLGAGIPPPQPSWGVSVSDGRALVATGWWISMFPGLAIMFTVLTFNSLGDWFRDHLDPRLKRR